MSPKNTPCGFGAFSVWNGEKEVRLDASAAATPDAIHIQGQNLGTGMDVIELQQITSQAYGSLAAPSLGFKLFENQLDNSPLTPKACGFEQTGITGLVAAGGIEGRGNVQAVPLADNTYALYAKDKTGSDYQAAVALVEAVRDGRIKKGDKILLDAFGGGLTWGAIVIEW